MARSDRRPRVLLLSMPWAPVDEPPLALGLLKAQLDSEGLECDLRHLQLELLNFIEPADYAPVAECFAINAFLFTGSLEGAPTTEAQKRLLERLLLESPPPDIRMLKNRFGEGQVAERLVALRDQTIPSYLDHCLGLVRDHPATLVGFSCLFEQTFASLALAARIKQSCPEKTIVFGGYALQEPVASELVRCFPFVDAVALGDGENKIAALAEASLDRRRFDSIPELVYRDAQGDVRRSPAKPRPSDLNLSPTPDYDGWFRDLEALPPAIRAEIHDDVLVAETSRGCWWGEVSHCVFCGIDDETMRYRYKSPDRALAMLETLFDRHPGKSIRFSDYILPRAYYRTVLPKLAETGGAVRLHWEIKSNIRKADADAMDRAGITSAQPGIESFSSSVLKKMSKGVTAAQNVLTLRLLAERKIGIAYNLLFGLPTDEPDEYREQLKTVPMLYHLPPPGSCMPIITVRYSPIQQNPARFGIEAELVPNRRYGLVLSDAYRRDVGLDWNAFCYAFERAYEFPEELVPLFAALTRQAEHWQALYREGRVQLSYQYRGDGVEFFDSRFSREGRTLSFGPAHAAIQRALQDELLTENQIGQLAAAYSSPGEFAKAYEELSAERLLFREGGRIVALALPAAYYEQAGRAGTSAPAYAI